MTKQSIKKNFWVLAFSGLLAFLLLPTDSFAQSRKVIKQGGNDTYTSTTTRNTAKRDYTTRTRTATPTQRRAVAKRDYTTRTRSTANRSVGTRGTSKATRATQTRASAANTTTRRANRTTNTATNRAIANRTRATTNRYATGRSTRNTASNYTYRANERNDYCNNYYRGINNWNRTFWLSSNYTPSYYDLYYNSFPLTNGLQAQKVRYLGNRYWFYDGIWFKKRFGRYYAVDAPLGLSIDALPLGGDMVWYQGEKYVIYRGTAYRMLPFGGFQVVSMLNRF